METNFLNPRGRGGREKEKVIVTLAKKFYWGLRGMLNPIDLHENLSKAAPFPGSVRSAGSRNFCTKP